jgi:hypothetical protein
VSTWTKEHGHQHLPVNNKKTIFLKRAAIVIIHGVFVDNLATTPTSRKLKDEFKGRTLRQKCWPMPPEDVAEIDKQVQELVDAGLVEPFPVGTFPKHCSPTFLVDKKESKTRRMVGQYVKLNKMTKPHAGFLPNMEEMIENLAKCRYKSKMDLRSGFWQIGLSDRAKELCAFVTPSGRCYQWLCMPFGLQGAPGVFQEMMEILCSKVKLHPQLKALFQTSFLGAFFDDCGLGTQTKEEHLILLEEFLKVCLDAKIRIKLSKCEFVQEDFEYLGFFNWMVHVETKHQKGSSNIKFQDNMPQRSPTFSGSNEFLPKACQQFHPFFFHFDRFNQEGCQMAMDPGTPKSV